ncbi:MAG: PilZ domain-containing protein [Deltaproteobacteria bacterium]|nr:MAG: PilZ domain-containing protein [Deltaproteobacteria bacterium]
MESREGRVEPVKKAFVVGQAAFTNGQLVEALRAGGFDVERNVVDAGSGSLGLIELPGGPEVALLYSAGVRLIGVAKAGEGPPVVPSWPFEAVVHAGMSAETILQVCNDVYYHNRGIRKFRRIPVQLEVVVFGRDRALRTTTVNFSAGGVFVRSLNPFPVGYEVKLRLVDHPIQGQLKGSVLYIIGFEGNRLVRLDRPDTPVVAHPGMAIQFSEGQDETIDRWMQVAEIKPASPARKMRW